MRSPEGCVPVSPGDGLVCQLDGARGSRMSAASWGLQVFPEEVNVGARRLSGAGRASPSVLGPGQGRGDLWVGGSPASDPGATGCGPRALKPPHQELSTFPKAPVSPFALLLL